MKAERRASSSDSPFFRKAEASPSTSERTPTKEALKTRIVGSMGDFLRVSG